MEKPIVYCYKKCSTCQKAIKWLNEKRVPYIYKEITEEPPSPEDIIKYSRESGIPIKSFFNANSRKYRSLNLKEKLGTMSDEEMADLLSSDRLLIKRPLLVVNNKVIPGFKIVQWMDALSEADEI